MPRGIPSTAVCHSCKCGCGRAVKRVTNDYYGHSCVPSSLRSAAARKSRRAFTLQRKARLFGDLLKRLDAIHAEGERMTRSDLIGVFDLAYQRGYDNGYHASDVKWVRRPSRIHTEVQYGGVQPNKGESQ